MKNFIYDVPTKVYFGKGQISHVGEELAKYGKTVLLVYGGGSIKRMGLYDQVMAKIKKAGLSVVELPGIDPNPRIDSVREGVKLCKEHKVDVILAVGGGSVIDASKVVAAGALVDFDAWDFVCKHISITKALPLVTVLTMAATGSEMDAVAVISNPATKEKDAAWGAALAPKASILDPEYTYTVPKYQTACGCADIMSHLLETYFNPGESMYMLDSMMEAVMKTVVKYAPIALEKPDNYEARANIMWAASWAINGLFKSAQYQVWACHGLEHELSAYYDITHGLGLAILTPRLLKYWLDETNVQRYVNLGVNVFGLAADKEPMALAEETLEALRHFLYADLGLKNTLTAIGIGEEHIPEMAKAACAHKGGTIHGFKDMLPEDVEKVYRMCL